MAVLHDLIHLFYPESCPGCTNSLVDGEQRICLDCLSRLPKTGYASIHDNKVARLFWGRVDLAKATAVYFFEKDSRLQGLIHALKYMGQGKLGLYLGRLMAQELDRSHWLDDIDILVPVPLHSKKKRHRGFNQAEMIARGIAGFKLPWEERALKRIRHSSSQTKKSRIQRWDNMNSIMAPGKSVKQIVGRHVLLVDDIVTTGATLEACAHVLLEQGAAKVSICTLACTFT